MTLIAANILIVEDDDLNCELLKRRLTNDGYKITTASSAKDAIQLLETSKFDLILLDIMLPDMNGDMVLEKIKSDPVLAHIPVIMVSANGEREMVLKCIDSGAIDYLVKPFSMSVVSPRISRCLKNASSTINNDRLKHSKILLADDQELNRDVLAHRLKKSGYQISSFTNGYEALSVLRNETFDLILLDIMMPDISGIEVLKEIRKLNNHRDTPVIMLTALDTIETIDECMKSGADDYILKPFNTSLLKLRISSCLQSRMCV